MTIVAIIQARMNATRLPGKVLLPLAGRPLMEQVYARVARAKNLDRVLMAVPASDANAMRFDGVTPVDIPFQDWFFYDGQENDLVGRYVTAAERVQAELIVRIPCDNPCIDPDYLDAAIDEYRQYPYAYYTNTTARCGGKWVDGLGCEVFSMSRLRWLDEKTQGGDPRFREHPHLSFNLHLPPADLRLDVNTAADYERIKALYEHFGHNQFTAQEAVEYALHQEVTT